MIIKGQRLSLDKKNLPPYIYKINLALVVFFAVWFILFLPVCIVVGLIYGEQPVTYITMIIVFALFFIGLAIIFPIDLKLRERLIKERAEQLEKEFADMPLEEAEKILKENNVINDTGFISSDKDVVFSDNSFPQKFVIPFENADISIFCSVRSTVIDVYACLYDDREEDKKVYLKLDRALFNFLDKRNLIVYEDELDFTYLKNDKKNFCRRAFGFKIK